MDYHVKQFFDQFSEEHPTGNYYKVIALHEAPDVDWKNLCNLVPDLCRGWHELAHLKPEDRIEFTRDYWLAKLPYHAAFVEFLNKFFSGLDDIGIYITQRHRDDPLETTLVYSLKDNSGFYRGSAAATEQQLTNLQKAFKDFILPNDYLCFLQIHNGFCKTTDMTGITSSELLLPRYQDFQAYISSQDGITTSKEDPVNPKTLVPFYESFGMPFFQCFWSEWYPEQEMGNVYYSGLTNTISHVKDIKDLEQISSKELAFPTFLDWLMFYLERVS